MIKANKMEEKIRPILKTLAINESREYPAYRGAVVRATAQELKQSLGMEFETRTDANILTVTRKS